MLLMDQKQRINVNISSRTVVRTLLIILAFYIFLKFLIKVDHIIELIFLALFLSIALNPAVSWISRQLKIRSRFLATGIAYLIVVVVLGLFIYFVVPPLARQTASFIKDIPNKLSDLENNTGPLGAFVNHYHVQNQVNDIAQYIRRHFTNFTQPVISTASRVWSAFVGTITVLVLTFFMLVEGPVWNEQYWKLRVAKKTTDRHRVLLERMYKIVTGYVNGQVLLAAIGAIVTFVALAITSSILNVSINSVAFAGIVFLTGLIPLIGHLIGGSIVVVACLFVSLPLAIVIAVFLILYQWLENVTFQPYIQAKYNELTPLLVLIAALIGAGAGGLVGAFVAIPLAGILKVLVKEVLVDRNLIELRSKADTK